jgi:predicted porin
MILSQRLEYWRLCAAVLPAMLLPAAAWAQSSVTLYGTLDAGLMYTSKSPNATGQNAGRQFEFVSSGQEPTRIGLTGQEDLGGGLSARFKLESGVSLANGGFDNDNGGLFGRNAWVSLFSENLGEVRAGLQWSPFILALLDSDPRSMSQFGSAITVYSNNTFDGTFTQNAITYISPKIYGVTASLMYALGGVAGNFRAGDQYSASLKYEYGGLMANAAIFDGSSSRDADINNSFFTMPFEGRTVGLAYRFSSFGVKASFTNYKAPETLVDGVTGGGDNNVWNVGFNYFVTPALEIDSGVWIVRDPHDSNNHSLLWAMGSTYSLSKSTSLYAQVGLVNNHGREILGLDRDGAQEGVQGTTVGANFGIFHKF